MAVNRNDPCPCGSGKKYKHCHMKIDQAKARSGESTRDVRKVITPRTIPYFYWKRWNVARQRGEFGLLYDMTHVDGPFRTGFDSRVAFFAHAQSHPLPSGPGWNLEKIKLDRENAWVLSARGVDDPTQQSVELELMHLRRTKEGLRLWDVKHERVRKPDDGSSPFLAFDAFGLESADLAQHKRVENGYERPDLADHPDEDVELTWSDPSVLKEWVERRKARTAGTDEDAAAAEAEAEAAEAEARAADEDDQASAGE